MEGVILEQLLALMLTRAGKFVKENMKVNLSKNSPLLGHIHNLKWSSQMYLVLFLRIHTLVKQLWFVSPLYLFT